MKYIEREKYMGFDPYDALKSPFFRLPILRSIKLIRFGAQQFVKRFPINLRPILFVPKGCNPVTLGLSIQAYAYLFDKDRVNRDTYYAKIDSLVSQLEDIIPKGFSGACWGYDFDWEARNAKIPAYQPTVVATGIISNALFIANQVTGHQKASRLVISAANFVLNDLKRTFEGDTFCFSYSPFDNQKVFNASMKGSRLLSQAYFLNQNIDFKIAAEKSVEFVIKHQKSDGSWGYSLANSGGWTDNYHTGYVLDCLDEYQKLSGTHKWDSQLKIGYEFYIKHFIQPNGCPNFYHDKPYPIDCTAAAQTILTTLRFGGKELANRTAEWMLNNMQKRNGSFKFRKYKNHTESTSFMRWSDAWMFAALSNL